MDSAILKTYSPASKIIEGSQGSLKSLGLSGPETVKVVQVVVFSMTQSLNGRESYLPSSSADSGSSPLQTAISKVAKTSISRLDEAGISPSDISNASSSLSAQWSEAWMREGLKASELSGAVETITSGATSALGDIDGIGVGDLSSVIEGGPQAPQAPLVTSVSRDTRQITSASLLRR